MSKFLVEELVKLSPYVPGEQPQDKKYIKLNTNESPFPPSPFSQIMAREVAGDLQLYSDPECKKLVNVAAEKLDISPDEIMFTNGSDEILYFAFKAFCDKNTPAVFPDITYGFYNVFAKINNVSYEEIPLNNDFSINVNDYIGIDKTIFIANPNAPTGIALSLNDVEKIVSSNKNNIVVIDEAYVDFGTESAVKLIKKYDNLLVTQTFSKSRSLAGGRLGMGIARKNVIDDLKKIKYSFNPYNVNTLTANAGIGALLDTEYFNNNVNTIIKNRDFTVNELKKYGFSLTNSKANFIFAKSNKISGENLYKKLKEKGILVRYFDKDRLRDYVRITIGDINQMKALLDAINIILGETL